MEYLNLNFAKHDTVMTEWFAFEPGDCMAYEIGLSRVPNFTSGVDHSYIQVIYKKGYYQFREDQFVPASDEEFGGLAAYMGEKINVDKYTALVLIKFITQWLQNKKLK